jgi:hypothetical protein
MADKLLDRLTKLLAQADAAFKVNPDSPEYHAFITKAQQLATDNSVDLAQARRLQAKNEKTEKPEVRRIMIGDYGQKNNALKCELVMAIGRVQGLQFTISQKSVYVMAHGFPSDIDVTEALYASLVVQMVEAGDAHVAGKSYVGETFWGEKRTKGYWGWETNMVEKKVDGRVARTSFYTGFTSKISQRLREARDKAVLDYDERNALAVEIQDRNAATTFEPSVKPVGFDSAPGAALALQQKEVEVRDFYKEKNKNLRGSWKGGAGASNHGGASRVAGQSAGSRARISSAKQIGR